MGRAAPVGRRAGAVGRVGPETKAEAEYTLAYIRNFANKKASAITNGKAKVIDIIKKYSEKGISNIKESDYAAFIQDLEVLQ